MDHLHWQNEASLLEPAPSATLPPPPPGFTYNLTYKWVSWGALVGLAQVRNRRYSGCLSMSMIRGQKQRCPAVNQPSLPPRYLRRPAVLASWASSDERRKSLHATIGARVRPPQAIHVLDLRILRWWKREQAAQHSCCAKGTPCDAGVGGPQSTGEQAPGTAVCGDDAGRLMRRFRT